MDIMNLRDQELPPELFYKLAPFISARRSHDKPPSNWEKSKWDPNPYLTVRLGINGHVEDVKEMEDGDT